ncbi:hypothetical protein [Haloprofundus salilacus]|uniref:hypothetical protein n=1 Tax=Haloprofundus salilacus TaxID=2876190 RepID=UPI001CCD0EE6|nr:hypothetical protein [Haloprofundus salilacus]
MRERIGRVGTILLVALFAFLFVEDLYIWFVSGTVPGVEFFAGTLVVVAIWYVAIRIARSNQPPMR